MWRNYLIHTCFDALKVYSQICMPRTGQPAEQVVLAAATCKHRRARLQEPGYFKVNRFSISPWQVLSEVKPFDDTGILNRGL